MPSKADAPSGRIAIGRVRRPHGVRGELSVQPYAAEPTRYASLAEVEIGGVLRRVVAVRGSGDRLLVRLAGVDDRVAAEALRGLELWVPGSGRAPLGPGRYYVDDLIGLSAVDRAGETLGRVEEVLPMPAHDVLRLSTPHGEGLVPMVRAMVVEIDLEAGRMVLDLPAGLLPEAAKPKPAPRRERS